MLQGAARVGSVDSVRGLPGAEVRQETGQVSSPGPRKIVSACGGGLFRQRGDVQAAQADVRALSPVVVGER